MLTPSFAPRRGGVETHVRRVAAELLASGIDLRLATPQWDPAWPAEETAEGLPVTRLSLSTREGRGQLAPLVRWAEVVHTHDAYPFLKYYLPFRFSVPRPPVFVTFHGFEGYPIPLEAKVLRRAVLWLTRGSLCAGAFIPKWYRFHCDRITHGGVDCPERLPEGPREGVVFAGRLEPDTGFLAYLEGYRQYAEAGGQMPLTVLGDGSLRAQGEDFCREHGLAAGFHGRVEDVTPWLANARVALVSGLLGMLEAQARGARVVALYDNPLKEDYLRMSPQGEHAALCGSAKEVAAALAGEPDETAIAGAFAFAQTQTWARVADLYRDLYRTVKGGRR
jgi:glycosyltransferase involved in cell wall biosynthesis